MNILIHACPQRMWYVEDFLVPDLLAQGADSVAIWNDDAGLGNLGACVMSFSMMHGSGETWHLQDDVLPCRDFVARIREHPGGVAYGFCTKLFGDDISLGGLVYAQDAWHSFQCVCIPDRYARDFAAWFSRGDWKNSPNPELYTMQKLGKGDDSFFREYLLSEHGTESVINYAPNLVEHIDWLIGGSSLGHWQRHMPRSARWEDEELVSELRERLRQRRPKP